MGANKETKEQASELNGTTAGTEQVSEQGQDNQSQTSGMGSLDLTQKFVLNPKRPDQVVTGEQLREAYGRARLYDQTLSEKQKLETQLQELQAKAERAELLLQEERTKSVFNQMSKSRSLESEKDTEDILDDWLSGGEKEPPPRELATPPTPRRETPQADNEILTQISKLNDQINELQKQRTRDVEDTRLREFSQAELRQRQARIRQVLPDVETDVIENIIANDNQAQRLEAQYRDAYAGGDLDQAMGYFEEARQYRDRAIDILADAKIKQRQITEQKEANTFIDSQSLGNPNEPLNLGDYQPSFNPDTAAKKEKELLGKAREKFDRMRKQRQM